MMNQASPIKIGDVVRLNSGGPRMTVKSINGNDVTCEWFDETKVQEQSFSLRSLKHAPDGINVPVVNSTPTPKRGW